MSKRHRKTKDMMRSSGGDDETFEDLANYDLSMFEAPKGKKPKGRQRRQTHKRSYLDD